MTLDRLPGFRGGIDDKEFNESYLDLKHRLLVAPDYVKDELIEQLLDYVELGFFRFNQALLLPLLDASTIVERIREINEVAEPDHTIGYITVDGWAKVIKSPNGFEAVIEDIRQGTGLELSRHLHTPESLTTMMVFVQKFAAEQDILVAPMK